MSRVNRTAPDRAHRWRPPAGVSLWVMNARAEPAAEPAPLTLAGEALRADPAPLWKEWTLTNGLGGYAMGTLLGTPTRRYHGLLVSAERPPVQRVVVLTQIHETLILNEGAPDEHRCLLTPLHFASSDDRPENMPELVSFELGTSCTWTYRVKTPSGQSVEIKKAAHLFGHRNTCAVEYTLGGEGVAWRLELRPLVALRGFHRVTEPDDFEGRFGSRTHDGVTTVSAGEHGLRLWSRGARLTHAPERWRDVLYAWERRRGLEDREDLFCPGPAHSAGDGREQHTITLWASTDTDLPPTIEDDRQARRDRLAASVGAVLERAPEKLGRADRLALTRLVGAGDQFIVRRGRDETSLSVIAGYPWFSDWGRDAMISLPGLLLVTGRFGEALGVLRTFAGARRNGLIPNRFDDYAGENHYNTVDASLWFVHACCEYLRASGDRSGFDSLVPACADIIGAYTRGTDFQIRMDPVDALISAGDETTQLTWMDAQRGGITFTPRHGKCVEINALWYNALMSLGIALRETDPSNSERFRALGARVRASFSEAFTDERPGLIDHLTAGDGGAWVADRSVRPNQIFAVSLPCSPVSVERGAEVVRVVRERLLTPMGLRTLDPDDPEYRGRYEGDLMQRDAAYHNGTVWPWLLGPYAEAVMRVGAFSDESRAEACAALAPLIGWLERGWSPGQLPEIFDGDDEAGAPREADGCPAQAWSVGETLRVWLLALGDGARLSTDA